MENLTFTFAAPAPAAGAKALAITGVVASGNLEVLIERTAQADLCVVEIATAAHGFGDVWKAVLQDFVDRNAAGGLHLSVNDGGARPDTVAIRLAQGLRLIAETAP